MLNNFTVCDASVVLPPNILPELDVVADSDVLLNAGPPKIFAVAVVCGEPAGLKAIGSLTWLILSASFGREVFFFPSKSFDAVGAPKTFLAADGWL